MALQNAYHAYKEMDVKTASQGKLILMLYDCAIRHLKTALQGLNTKPMPIQRIHNSLIAAQDIVHELRNSLNTGAGDLALNLARIYEYVNRRLVRGNVKKASRPIEEALNCLSHLRDTWKELFEAHPECDRTAPAAAEADGSRLSGTRNAGNGERLSINL